MLATDCFYWCPLCPHAPRESFVIPPQCIRHLSFYNVLIFWLIIPTMKTRSSRPILTNHARRSVDISHPQYKYTVMEDPSTGHQRQSSNTEGTAIVTIGAFHWQINPAVRRPD